VAGREQPSRCSLERYLWNSLSRLFFGAPVVSIVGGMRCPSVHQLAVTACRYRCHIGLFRTFIVQVTAPTPHETGRLLAIGPDTAEFLTAGLLRALNTASARTAQKTPLPTMPILVRA
jgi:hypothetical protein